MGLRDWLQLLLLPAKPDVSHWAAALPKTRSGKIMQRILHTIADSKIDSLGDLSTLLDLSITHILIMDD